jgi:hypothetical protein
MAIKVSGVKWHESVEVIADKKVVTLQVMTKAGRLFRSTSFRLTKQEALRLAAELKRQASRL